MAWERGASVHAPALQLLGLANWSRDHDPHLADPDFGPARRQLSLLRQRAAATDAPCLLA